MICGNKLFLDSNAYTTIYNRIFQGSGPTLDLFQLYTIQLYTYLILNCSKVIIYIMFNEALTKIIIA